MSLLIGIFTFVLILVSLFLVLLVLMQKAKNDGGMGAALGGGATEATFGADTGNVLTKATINSAIAFFVLSLGLYLGHIHMRNSAAAEAGSALPDIEAPAGALPDFAPVEADAAPAVVAPELEAPAATEDAEPTP
ncbi:preprotein translocase subunit SecG [bacterium]|nr:preprotein translocase subunit SecG [bacterium]